MENKNCPWRPVPCPYELNSELENVFIIASTADDRDDYRNIIINTVESCGFIPRFATILTEFNNYDVFCTNICSEIKKSRFVITDLSGERLYNPVGCQCPECEIEDCRIGSNILFSMNVYLEYGLASGLNKRIILLCDETHNLPFNVGGLHHEPYTLENLESKLINLIDLERGRAAPESQEIHEYIDVSEDLRIINIKFSDHLASAEHSTDLEIRMEVSPLNLIEELFGPTDYQDLKQMIRRELIYGPMVDSISRVPLFGDLESLGEGFEHIDNSQMGGSIIISRKGNIIYFWHDKKHDNNDWLQTYYISAYLITFFTFLRDFYQRLNYSGEFSIKISIGKLLGWRYSPLPSFMPVHNPYTFRDNTFTPLIYNLNTDELSDINNIFSNVEEILSEILLACGYDGGFSIRSDLKDQYNG